MASVIYVKSARQRYDADGMVKPLLTCDKCTKEIAVGSSYRHMSIKIGPRSSRKLVRCDDCPAWHVWEYSNSTSSRVAQIVYEAQEALTSTDDIDSAMNILQTAADAARELADEKREGASNIEDGFGHSTSQSDELTDLADQLEEWATSLETASIPDYPDPEDAQCETCAGSGEITEEGAKPAQQACPDCHGKGYPNNPTEEQIDQWRDELIEISELSDNPV
jgi:predicted  nucleic acid-binding Zn-ribbon protein